MEQHDSQRLTAEQDATPQKQAPVAAQLQALQARLQVVQQAQSRDQGQELEG